MPSRLPRITISVAHSQEESDTSGDITSLSFGFGLFSAWFFISIFGLQPLYSGPSLWGDVWVLSEEIANVIFNTYVITLCVSLLSISLTNQTLLRFYVGKPALVTATTLAAIGTLAVMGVNSGGTLLAVVSGIAMGSGAGLMICLWGTAYARYEFSTIILNSILAAVIGLLVFMAITLWVPSPVSGILASLTVVISSYLLWGLTPIPYFRRQIDIPIFRPLPVKTMAFFLRFGIPSFMFGVAASGLRHVCLFAVVPSSDLTSQLLIGAAACLSVAIVLITLAISKNESHWDVIFRALVPVTAIGICCLPLLGSNHVLLGCLGITCGFICFEALMWIFFSDLSQEFRLSPLFVFGLGRGLLVLGTICGSALVEFPLSSGNTESLMTFEYALPLMLSLIIAYSLLPRQREIRRIIDPSKFDKADASLSALRNELAEGSAGDDSAEADPPDEADTTARAKGRFHQKCEEIADRYLLSRRETEVMFLLAKGHNASFIQDKLCISKSTAKTHINHIYRKLDIHTQQELLNMVEDRENELEAKPSPATSTRSRTSMKSPKNR